MSEKKKVYTEDYKADGILASTAQAINSINHVLNNIDVKPGRPRVVLKADGIEIYVGGKEGGDGNDETSYAFEVSAEPTDTPTDGDAEKQYFKVKVLGGSVITGGGYPYIYPDTTFENEDAVEEGEYIYVLFKLNDPDSELKYEWYPEILHSLEPPMPDWSSGRANIHNLYIIARISSEYTNNVRQELLGAIYQNITVSASTEVLKIQSLPIDMQS